MMLLGKIKEKQASLYFDWDLWFSDTFSPDTEIITQILFKITGKTYQEKKENLRNLAIEYQTSDTSGLSWGEIADIENFFTINAKRFGLIKEFTENCII